jgi:hypothetical protein
MLTLGPTADRLSAISTAPLSAGSPVKAPPSAPGLPATSEAPAATADSSSSGGAANRDASDALLLLSCARDEQGT